MSRQVVVDVTDRTYEAAVTALCTFGEVIKTSAGRVEPDSQGFTLHTEGRKPRPFATASGAVEVLRRISR